ncbi:glucoamylase family protein [Catenuloplanes japonicus]|uniref:glucoamylase family protein n=1 Tax=Catenuloplanes japonicus TaxID=33876 RepID=UPI001E58057F|nr:glucoamylase family protein [Catenuloplanes japonicus]
MALLLIVTAAPAAAADPLRAYARDTWRSLAAMTGPSGLVADHVTGDLSGPSAYTSPTNIGGYLWSAVVARELGIISRGEAEARVSRTLDMLAALRYHEISGMFYNWYDPSTGAVLTVWPEDGSAVTPFLSSVDNGWLAAGLRVVQGAVPSLRTAAARILDRMDFGFFFNPAATSPIGTRGLIRGGFWDTPPPGCSVASGTVWFTCNHYDITVTEPRIATYLGIAAGQIPPTAYFDTMRTLPDSCDYAWQEMRPAGFTTTHLGRTVYEGSYRYRGITFVPSWGGDMFEALMPDLFVPEQQWGPDSWGRNHPATVAAQIEHGLHDARYGYWGFSPASDPFGGYGVYGVDAMGMDADGYPSDVEGGRYDAGFGDCRPAGPPAVHGDGVVTPHAVFLALPYAPGPARANLARIKNDLRGYGPGGFYDAVAVRSGRVAARYLSLDQSMIMGALGNVLAGDVVRRAFVTPGFARAIRPLLARETFHVPARQPLPQLGGGRAVPTQGS